MKKVKYQVSIKSFIWVEVNSAEDEKLIKDLNNEFDKAKKQDRTYKKNTISTDKLFDEFLYEISDSSPSILEKLIQKERKLEVRKAVNVIPKRQKEVIMEHFYENKSLRKIAREKKLNDKTVRESYHSAISNLRKRIKK